MLSDSFINKKISVLNETIINVISNYIPDETKVKSTANGIHSSFQPTANGIKSIIKKLKPNKVHDHNMISIRMIKLYGDYIYQPLEMILELV